MQLDLVTIVVADYDPAIAFFVDALGFELVEDTPSLTNDGRAKRWVVVRPPGAATGILLARADGARQATVVGDQVAGRVGFFLRVDDFDAAHERMTEARVRFVTAPRDEPYGRIAVFLDIAGNRWDLLGPLTSTVDMPPAKHDACTWATRQNGRVRIRHVRHQELPTLQEIERAAGVAFRDIGMPEIADDPPLPVTELAGYVRAGSAWVAVDATDQPIAYLIAEVVDGNLHIEQVSVHPGHARRGIGRGLIEHAAEHARREGRPALTLTTFTHVAWNAPYYARCGFRILAQDELTPGLVAIRQREATHGLDRWPRVCMRRDL